MIINTNGQVDFYLVSSEGYNLEEPRECRLVKPLMGMGPDGCILVRISPSIIGQQFGMGDKDVNELLLASRHVGQSLQPITCWPSYIYVGRPLISFHDRSCVGDNEFQLIAWAELYPTYERALKKE